MEDEAFTSNLVGSGLANAIFAMLFLDMVYAYLSPMRWNLY